MGLIEVYPFGDLLREFRARAKMSRRELAEKLGVHLNTVSLWERGDSVPKNKIRIIANALHLNELDTGKLLAAGRGESILDDTESFAHSPQSSITSRNIVGVPLSTYSSRIQQRALEVIEIYEQLIQADTTAVILTGLAGIGKSTLAALVFRYVEAQRLAGHGPFTAEALWLRVDSSVTMNDLAGTLLEALGQSLPDMNSRTPQNQALALFKALKTASQPRFIVIDQFEELVMDRSKGMSFANCPGFSEWLDALNSEICACRLLLTSRIWPQGTRTYRSISLQEYTVGGLQTSEGVELLQKEGVAGSDQVLHTAVERCSGHVFSLILLSSLVARHHLELQDMLQDDEYNRLWQGDIAHKILDSIYDHSLNDIQRKLLRAFSVYREPIPFAAARFLVQSNNLGKDQKVQPALDALLTQHLLQASGGGRYYPHAIVSDYAREHFHTRSEEANKQALQAAHVQAAHYYQQLAKSYPPIEQRTQASDAHPIVEAVWHLCQAEQWQQAYTLMEQENLYNDLHRFGGNATLLELYQYLLPQSKWSQDHTQDIRLYYHLAQIYRVLGMMEQSGEYRHKELQLCRAVGERKGEALVLMNLGWYYHDLGDKLQAKACHENALQIYQEIADLKGEGRALSALGWFYISTRDKQNALLHLQQALKLCSEVGDKKGVGVILSRLASLYDDLNQKEEAKTYTHQAITIFREVHAQREEAWGLGKLGQILITLAQREEGKFHLEQALHIFREVQDRRGEAWVLAGLGWVSIELNQQEQAKQALEQALSIFQDVHDRWGEGTVRHHQGQLAALAGNSEQAIIHYRQALHIRKSAGDIWGTGLTLFSLGLFFLEQKMPVDVALAAFLLAHNIFEEAQSSSYQQKAQEQINMLQAKLAEAQNPLTEAEMFAVVEQALTQTHLTC